MNVVRILEPVRLTPPAHRLRQLEAVYASDAEAAGALHPIQTVEELAAAFRRHTGRMDCPHFTPQGLADFQETLESGTELVQYELTLNPKRPRYAQRDLPPDTPLLGARRLAGLLAISKHSVYPAFERGLLRLVESSWKGALQRYAIVDERMAAWCSQYERWVAFDRITIPATTSGRPWFDESDLESSGGGRSPAVRTKGDAVLVGIDLLRFAASRPEALMQSRRVLSNRVFEEE